MAFNLKKSEPSPLYTVAFYNLENLFDTVNDPDSFDEDFLPTSEKKWNIKRYQKKLYKLGNVIASIGQKETGKPPAIIGVAEVENLSVLEDLTSSKHLKEHEYGIVHYDSPDERGIDVGLLYHKKHFEVKQSKPYKIELLTESGKPDYTRDVLWVEGILNGENIHLLINHWPSRRDGSKETVHKRIKAAEVNRSIIDEIQTNNPEAKIIIMGDFNDNPSNDSVKKHLVQQDFYNPMFKLHTHDTGSLNYRSEWNLFDQIIISINFHKFELTKHSFSFAKIFDEQFLRIFKGRFKNTPFRTYAGRKYKGGYSDHFPVYIVLDWNTKSN